MPKKGKGPATRPQCQVKVTGTNGKTIKCGMPLNSANKCPEHGRPY